MLRLLIITLFVLTTTAQAQRFKLASVTNSMDSDIYELYVEATEAGALSKLVGKTIKGGRATKKTGHAIVTSSEDNKNASVDFYTLEQLQKKVVLVERSGRNVVDLKSIDIDPLAGGTAELSYLRSGISGKRVKVHFTIIDQDGKWVMLTKQGKVVHSMHFTSKKLLGKVIGLDKIIIK